LIATLYHVVDLHHLPTAGFDRRFRTVPMAAHGCPWLPMAAWSQIVLVGAL
jgi:hypothetical protein